MDLQFKKLEKLLIEYGVNKKEREKYINERKAKAKRCFKVMQMSCEEVIKDMSQMYESFIDQFYQYITVSYRRHEVHAVGTGTGINLYRADNIKFYSNNDIFSFQIGINANDGTLPMDGGYAYDTKEDVLDYVLDGFRFKKKGKRKSDGNPYNIEMTWLGDYKSNITSFEIYDVTPNEAFEAYNEQFDDLLRERIRANKRKK